MSARTPEGRILAVCGNGPIESPDEVALVMAWARLGARVLEILPKDGASATARLCALEDIDAAARSLGLLGEEARRG